MKKKGFLILFFCIIILYSLIFADENEQEPIKISIIYDNYIFKKDMKADWGFSCFIEGAEKKILFDTGTKGNIFLKNMEKMGIKPVDIDMIAISHEHGDHTGGLFSLLKKNNKLPVILPSSFSTDFVNKAEKLGGDVKLVKESSQICKDVYSNGALDAGWFKEQSIAIDTKKGLVIICGCSHPGIIKIIKEFKKKLKKDVFMVLGGFHLMNKSNHQMDKIIQEMKALGVKKCGASHCTGEKQIQMFKKAFGNDYIKLGVGRILTF